MYLYCDTLLTESTIIFPFLFRLVKYLTRSRSRAYFICKSMTHSYTIKGDFLHNINGSFHHVPWTFTSPFYAINAFFSERRNEGKRSNSIVSTFLSSLCSRNYFLICLSHSTEIKYSDLFVLLPTFFLFYFHNA